MGGIIVFTLAVRSLAGLSTLKSLQLEVEEAKRKERYLKFNIFNHYDWIKSRLDDDELKHTQHPKSPARSAFDSESSDKIRHKKWGPLTIPKRALPNFLPIPLFIAGSLSARSLVESSNVDLAGHAFRVDTSFLWMDNLTMPDPYLALLGSKSD